MVQLRQQLAIEPMREGDVPVVQEIEKEIFSTPWPRNAYYRELASRNTAHYIVLRRDRGGGSEEGQLGAPRRDGVAPADPRGGPPPQTEIIGYGGMWRMYDEAHVTTIGVRRDQQRGGFGRIVFAALVQAAYDLGAKWITLEVRTSNENAQRMYENFGFKVIGRRRGYYTDNGEDAIVMWSDSIYSPRFRKAFEVNLARIDAEVAGLRREKPLTNNP